MRELKICTGDDIYLELYKDGLKSGSTVRKFSTHLDLLKKTTPSSQVTLPPEHVLALYSPSKKREREVENVCQQCGAEYKSPMDVAFDSKWIGCQHLNSDGSSGCNRWNHAKCLGLDFAQNVKSVKWFCPIHRAKPPRNYSKKAPAEKNKKQKSSEELLKEKAVKKTAKKTAKKLSKK